MRRDKRLRRIAVREDDEPVKVPLCGIVDRRLEVGTAPADGNGFLERVTERLAGGNSAFELDYLDFLDSVLEGAVHHTQEVAEGFAADRTAHVKGDEKFAGELPHGAHIVKAGTPGGFHPREVSFL